MASNDKQWPQQRHGLHPNGHFSFHVSYLSLSVPLCQPVCLFMLSACHLSISVFISVFITLLCLLRLTPSLAHSFTLPTVSLPVQFSISLPNSSSKSRFFSSLSVLALVSWVSLMFSWTPSAFHQGLSSSTSLFLSHSQCAKHSVFTVSPNLHRNHEQFVKKKSNRISIYSEHKSICTLQIQ